MSTILRTLNCAQMFFFIATMS